MEFLYFIPGVIFAAWFLYDTWEDAKQETFKKAWTWMVSVSMAITILWPLVIAYGLYLKVNKK